jgi:hypothetical protein
MRGAPGNARDSLGVRGLRAWSPKRAPVACGCPGSFFAIRGPSEFAGPNFPRMGEPGRSQAGRGWVGIEEDR